MNEALWQRVEDALDARSNPLDDPVLQEGLAREPETLAAARRLMGRLELLPVATRPDATLPVATRPVATRPVATRRMRPAQPWVRRAVVAASLLVVAGLVLRALARPTQSVSVDQRSLSTAVPEPDVSTRSTISLVVETTKPPRARGARVVLEPRSVIAWNLEER